MEPKYTIHLERSELIALILGMYESADLHEAKGRPFTAEQHRAIARRLYEALYDIELDEIEEQTIHELPGSDECE